jgi:hypothetical protein
MNFTHRALALTALALALVAFGSGPDANNSGELVVKEGVAQFTAV